MSKLMVAYLLEKGGTELPRAREALTAITTLVQRHFLKHLGRTFELERPLITVMEGPFAAGANEPDFGITKQFLSQRFDEKFNKQRNVVVAVLQGTTGDAGGSFRIVKMTGGFWQSAYDLFMNRPHLLTSDTILPWAHELGHAYGLLHSEDTRVKFDNDGIKLGNFPSFTMQRKQNLNTLYNHGFHVAERRMLIDPDFHQEKLILWSDAPDLRPADALSRTTVSPRPDLPVSLSEWMAGDLTLPFDMNGKPDLFFIKRRQSGSGTVEIQKLSRDSNYSQLTPAQPSAVAAADEANGDFLLGGAGADGIPDLFFIKRTNTGHGNDDLTANFDRRIEVHRASGSQGFQQFTVHARTSLLQIEDAHGDFLMGDFDRDGIPDLFFIKRRLTGSGKIEVHILSGQSGYQDFIRNVATPLDSSEDLSGDFLLGDFDGDGIPDLYYIKRRHTGSGKIEVHIVSGASNYQQIVLSVATPLSGHEDAVGCYATGDFDGDGKSDLYFIKREETGTGRIEAHILSAESSFQRFVFQTGTPLTTTKEMPQHLPTLATAKDKNNQPYVLFSTPPTVEFTSKPVGQSYQPRVAIQPREAALGSVVMTPDLASDLRMFVLHLPRTATDDRPVVFSGTVAGGRIRLEQSEQALGAQARVSKRRFEAAAAMNVVVENAKSRTFLDLVTYSVDEFVAVRSQTSGEGNTPVQTFSMGSPATGSVDGSDYSNLIVRQNASEMVVEAFVMAPAESNPNIRSVFHNKQGSPAVWGRSWKPFVASNAISGSPLSVANVLSFAAGSGSESRVNVFALAQLTDGTMAVIHAKPGADQWRLVSAASLPDEVRNASALASRGLFSGQKIAVGRMSGGVVAPPGPRLAVFVVSCSETNGVLGTAHVHASFQVAAEADTFHPWQPVGSISGLAGKLPDLAIDHTTTTPIDILATNGGDQLFVCRHDPTGFPGFVPIERATAVAI